MSTPAEKNNVTEVAMDRLDRDVRQVLLLLQTTREEMVEQRTVLANSLDQMKSTERFVSEIRGELSTQSQNTREVLVAFEDFENRQDKFERASTKLQSKLSGRVETIERRMWMAMGVLSTAVVLIRVLPIKDLF